MLNDMTLVTPRAAQGSRLRGRFWLRVGEAFFARWPLYFLPIIVLGAVGVMQTRNSIEQYRSAGVLSVSRNPLLQADEVRGTTIYSYETPGVGTARIVNEQLRTDSFVSAVAAAAGLQPAIDAGQIGLGDVRQRVAAFSEGDTLISVVGVWDDPVTAQQLASATISTYRQYVLDTAVSDTSEALAFYEEQLAKDQAAFEAAQEAYEEYILSHPAPGFGAERPADEVLDLQRLDSNRNKAETKLTETEAAIEAADLAQQTALSAAGQTLRIVDQPEAPGAPESTLMSRISTLFIFLVLGTIVGAGALLVAALLDRSVRTEDDILSTTGLAVIATVPTISALRHKHATAAAGSDESKKSRHNGQPKKKSRDDERRVALAD